MEQNTTASFSFEPVNVTVSKGDIIPLDVMIYSGDDPVISTDAWIAYDPTMLSISTPQNPELIKGELFQSVDAKIISPGRLYIYAINPSHTEKKETNGKLATVYFKAEKSGQVELRFECNPFSTQTSQIIKNDEELNNIINCTSTQSHTSTVTIGNSGSVLGVSVNKTMTTNLGYVVATILLLILTGVLFMRYRKLMQKLKTK